MMRRSAWLIALGVLVMSCQFLQPRGSSSDFTPEVLPRSASPGSSTEAVESSPESSQTPFPADPSETAIPPSLTPSPTLTPIPSAVSFPDPNAYTWSLVVDGLRRPTDLTHADDGSGRLFVIEQSGQIRIIRDSQLEPEPFLDISDRVVVASSEQGLLGLVFHPQYETNGYFYVNYTDSRGATNIARFQVTDDLDKADPDSEQTLLQVGQPYPNHNGGGLAFGPDGMLYAALGDGGSANDPQGNGQFLNTLLGKILRLDVTGGEPYAIPADNPFVSGGGLLEIWAYGLRNPWRIAFDSLTGDLFNADVGQGTWEEINFQAAGEPGGQNYGWVYREGAHPFRGAPPAGVTLIDPVAEYDHSFGCSVTGGHVYRGATLPEWQGIYLYGDYCSGIVWGLLRDADGGWQDQLLFQTNERISSFGLDEAGEIYLVTYDGRIYRLAAAGG